MPVRPPLSGLKVPDEYPPIPQSADIVRVAGPVQRPWRLAALAALGLLFLILGAVLWAAAEVRALRKSESLEALRKQHQEVERAGDEQRRDERQGGRDFDER